MGVSRGNGMGDRAVRLPPHTSPPLWGSSPPGPLLFLHRVPPRQQPPPDHGPSTSGPSLCSACRKAAFPSFPVPIIQLMNHRVHAHLHRTPRYGLHVHSLSQGSLEILRGVCPGLSPTSQTRNLRSSRVKPLAWSFTVCMVGPRLESKSE